MDRLSIIAILFLTLTIRCLLAYYLPLTGDEAYFIEWGKHPALGYYDHTPLLGWILYVLLFFGDSISLMRLPSVLLPTCIVLGLLWALRDCNRSKVYFSAILFLLSPPALLFIFISTDVPLVFFSFYSVIFLSKAIQKQDNFLYYLCAGLCLGLAFFSKYIAVLLALAYLIYYIFFSEENNRRRKMGFLIVFLCVIPFGLINLYWNYTHNWANIVFNVYDRNRFLVFKMQHLLFYLLSLIYIVTPLTAYYTVNKLLHLPRRENKDLHLILLCIGVPLLFFFLLSFIKSIGFHWVFSFTTLLYLCIWALLDENQIIKSIKFSIVLNGIQLFIIFLVLIIPIQTWKQLGLGEEMYTNLVSNFKHKEIRDYLNRYNANFVFASHTFSDVNTMMYDSKLPVYVFGYGSEHGRQGDFQEDFKALNNKNILIFADDKPQMQEYSPYFEKMELNSFDLYGAKFYYILGYHFKYPVYREKILRVIKDYFWHIPDYLPHKGNFYCQKYFPHLTKDLESRSPTN